jgi:hypothetical protein
VSKVIMGCAAVSIDGFIANESDEIGPLFDWAGNRLPPHRLCGDRPPDLRPHRRMGRGTGRR